MAGEYLSFEEVLEELGIDEEELKRLVSQGELRGFRDGRSMKFKRDDVVNLKRGKETEPTIILTDSDQAMGIAESSDELILDESTSDTVLNIGDIMGQQGTDSEIVFSDSTEEFGVSPIDSDPEAAIPTVEVPAVDDDKGIVESDSDAAMVEVGTSDHAETEQFELVEDEDETSDVAIAPRRTASGRISRSAKLRALEVKEKAPQTAWSVVAMISAAILTTPGIFLIARLQEVSPKWVLDYAENARGVITSLFLMF